MLKIAALSLAAAVLAGSGATAQDHPAAPAPESKGPLVAYVVRDGRAPMILRGFFHMQEAYGNGATVSEKFDIADPSGDMALAIARLVAAKYGDPAAPAAPVPIQEQRERAYYEDNKSAEVRSGAHYIVDVVVSLEAHPLLLAMNRYGVSVFGYLSVTDKMTNKVVARGHCIVFPQDKTPDSPTLTEMFDNHAASLKTMIATGASTCLQKLEADAKLG